jgi:hypothetical protein
MNSTLNIFKVFFLLTALVFVGCGSSETESSSASANPAKNANALIVNAVNPRVVNTAANNSVNINANRPMDAQIQRLEEMRSAANKSGKQIPNLNSRPAPEDSTITTTLTDVAREKRVWKKHPVLLSVEKVFDGGKGSIKVSLRDGRVIDLPGESIAQVDQIFAADVLTLAGIKPAAPKSTTAKRSDN